MSLFEPVFSALNRAGARYVVVGGLAVVLHGHARLTADVDLVLDLEPESARKAMEALKALGLKARAPVDPEAFADPRQREAWIADKGMTVFSLFSPASPLLILDLFVRAPIPFEGLWECAKTAVGRPQDLLDVEALRALKERARGATDG